MGTTPTPHSSACSFVGDPPTVSCVLSSQSQQVLIAGTVHNLWGVVLVVVVVLTSITSTGIGGGVTSTGIVVCSHYDHLYNRIEQLEQQIAKLSGGSDVQAGSEKHGAGHDGHDDHGAGHDGQKNRGGWLPKIGKLMKFWYKGDMKTVGWTLDNWYKTSPTLRQLAE